MICDKYGELIKLCPICNKRALCKLQEIKLTVVMKVASAILILQVLDVLSTMYALSVGRIETNVFFAKTWMTFSALFGKFGFCFALIFLCWLGWRKFNLQKDTNGSLIVLFALYTLVIFYTIVVSNNLGGFIS